MVLFQKLPKMVEIDKRSANPIKLRADNGIYDAKMKVTEHRLILWPVGILPRFPFFPVHTCDFPSILTRFMLELDVALLT